MADRLWAPRLDLGPIRDRLAAEYKRPRHAGSSLLRVRLARALSDLTALLAEVERSWQARDGFLEAIGKGVLRMDPSPTGRRKLRELAAKAREELAGMNRSRDHGAR